MVLARFLALGMATGVMATQPPIVDVTMFNDELSVLRYRIRLHAAFVSTFIVVESNLTWSGRPKRLHATEQLTAEEIEKFNVRIVQVPLQRAVGKRMLKNKVREASQRKFLNQYLLTHFPKHVVYISDVDEFLDPDAVHNTLTGPLGRKTTSSGAACVTPRLRMYYYSEHCPVHEEWAVGVLFRSDSRWFRQVTSSFQQLRGFANERTRPRTMHCPIPNGYHGWHFSFAMDTEHILSKMMSFKASDEVQEVIRLNQLEIGARTAIVEQRVRTCTDVFNRPRVLATGMKLPKGTSTCNISFQRNAYDGKLPQLPGWPRSPLAPVSMDQAKAMAGH